ncbi:MAG: ABC transporter ATP-binding protein [Bacteroides sp.]|nr:ABC transporter ATP-binding protein [Bacteroides sp.]MCM1390663.1 ABC transporter ATP-binding protein [Bacteroides sp.]
MLNVDNITFSYKRRGAPVLDHFSLSLEAGAVYGLLGKNGAGKSTLLYLIAGLLTPASGSVTFEGENTRKRLPSTLGEIFIVPEEFSFPKISLKQYVKATSGFYPNFSEEDLNRHLATFDLNPDLNLGELSMGQKKKAMMCFALACNTKLLLMDEPTNGLDIPGKSAFRRFIAQNMNDERTIIISTHQTRDIDRLIDHVVIMEKSEIILNEPMMSISSRLKFMTTTNPDLIAKALYKQPSIEGTGVVLLNDDYDETEVNLESLFELAITDGASLRNLFTSKTANLK